jgi:hypothetical protein
VVTLHRVKSMRYVVETPHEIWERTRRGSVLVCYCGWHTPLSTDPISAYQHYEQHLIAMHHLAEGNTVDSQGV